MFYVKEVATLLRDMCNKLSAVSFVWPARLVVCCIRFSKLYWTVCRHRHVSRGSW